MAKDCVSDSLLRRLPYLLPPTLFFTTVVLLTACAERLRVQRRQASSPAMQLPPSVAALRDAVLSMNSGAQARTFPELWRGAQPRHVLMEPLLVPLVVTMYLGLKPHMRLLCARLQTTGTSLPFRLFALMHNILLCAYSGWTATNVWSLTLAYYNAHGAESLYCTRGLWTQGMHFWGFLFYLSKYWELVDTALLIVKRRSPSYLQVYHHAVTIVCGYLLQASHSSVTFIFVGLNSAVHTIMYAYYAMTVLGVRFGAKSAITAMQIVQFIVGVLAALPMFFLRDRRCAIQSQKIAVAAIVLHAMYLTKLFTDFYRESYRRKTKKV